LHNFLQRVKKLIFIIYTERICCCKGFNKNTTSLCEATGRKRFAEVEIVKKSGILSWEF
jgi:hypothetical protein